METTETKLPEEHHEPNMVLTPEAQYYLQQAGKWAKFIGILGFIGSGLMALLAVFASTMFGLINQFSGRVNPSPVRMLGALAGIPYFILAVVVFFINLYLYQFGSKVVNGVAYQNNDLITQSLKQLKSFFNFKGVLLIVIICLYLLFIVVAIIGFSFVRRG